MEYGNEPQHDEINLIRLLRRLEKSVADVNEWKPNAVQTVEEVWLKGQKTLQKVKYARRLVKNIEVDYLDQSPKRIKKLNDMKIKLDRVDAFLKNLKKPNPPKHESILASLPIPQPPSDKTALPPNEGQASLNSLSPPPYSEDREKSRSPDMSTIGLSILPPDLDEISPTLITSALPSLLPVNPSEIAASASAYSRSFGPTPTLRNATGSMALHEELSSQLEMMAQQLKRNAIHFSTSLANDKAVVEDAGQKLESNYDVMQGQRTKLKNHSSKSGSTTWLVMGIVLVVMLLFMLMVSVIRFSR